MVSQAFSSCAQHRVQAETSPCSLLKRSKVEMAKSLLWKVFQNPSRGVSSTDLSGMW